MSIDQLLGVDDQLLAIANLVNTQGPSQIKKLVRLRSNCFNFKYLQLEQS